MTEKDVAKIALEIEEKIADRLQPSLTVDYLHSTKIDGGDLSRLIKGRFVTASGSLTEKGHLIAHEVAQIAIALVDWDHVANLAVEVLEDAVAIHEEAR